MESPRRRSPVSVPPDHPAAKLPRRRLAVLRPGMVVEGVIVRLVRGGALVDILLESGEPAFVPLNEIPHKAMPRVRELIEKGELQQVRLLQLDRANGTATASLHGLIQVPEEAGEEGKRRERGPKRPIAPPPPLPQPKIVPAAAPKTTSASERARQRQQDILRRLRGE